MKRLFWIGLTMLLAGCGHLGTDVDRRSALVSSLKPLAGRAICLDPGHGGPWPGAVAPANGLRESDVNLRVALRAEEILQNAGAEVVLTRATDAALAPGNLRSDLAARAAVANNEDADVFVSIHHNADIRRHSKKNDLEVYYRLGDHRTSLPLAQELTQALAYRLNKKAEVSRLLPGNYRVLRQARTPAVLLESSYLTNKKSARLLATPAGIEREAQAIAEGLAAYFALDPPRVENIEISGLDEYGRQRIEAACDRGYPIDVRSVVAVIDGSGVPGSCLPTKTGFTWVFADALPNGLHTVKFEGRNTQGAGFSASTCFDTKREAGSIHVTQRPLNMNRQCNIEVEVRVRVLDVLGLPVADGTKVILNSPRETSLTRDGLALFHMRGSALPPSLAIAADGMEVEKSVSYGRKSGRTVRVRDARSSNPIKGALVKRKGTALTGTSDEGWALVDADTSRVGVVADGYEEVSVALTEEHTEIVLSPVEDGVLHDMTIMVDPAFGGRRPGAVGTGGLRACDVALDVGTRLAEKLRAAGATVLLTRERDDEMSGLARVQSSMSVDVDLYVTVSFGMPAYMTRILNAQGKASKTPCRFVGHYPGSRNGRRLAEAIGHTLSGVSVVPSVAYELQQTACPAVLVQPEDVGRRKGVERCRDVSFREQWSEAICRAILAYARTQEGP